MEFQLPKELEQLKAIAMQRQQIRAQLADVATHIRAGEGFFKTETDKAKLAAGSKQMRSYVQQAAELFQQAYDIDTVLIAQLELLEILPAQAVCAIAEVETETGDRIKETDVIVRPAGIAPTKEMISVTPNDMYFWKLLKGAASTKKIDFVR